MNFEITSKFLDEISSYTENTTIIFDTDNKKNWKGKNYKSDFVIIDKKNNVGFEIFNNEIIVFCFTDHYHFEDYSSDLEDGEDDYIKRAKDFLIKLFENKIKYYKTYKGKKLIFEKYAFIYPKNTEKYIGSTWWGLTKFFNPFAKKVKKSIVYKFDIKKGVFEIIE